MGDDPTIYEWHTLVSMDPLGTEKETSWMVIQGFLGTANHIGEHYFFGRIS